MTRKSWLLAPAALALLAFAAARIVPGRRADGTTVLPSGWRIRPAGRQVTIGPLPLELAVAADGAVWVTNNGYAANGLMRIDPKAALVTDTLTLRAAWLGLAASGADTVWASGGVTARVYRFTRDAQRSWRRDSVILADSTRPLFAAGLALIDRGRRVAVVGNLNDSLYLIDATSLARTAAYGVGHKPYTVVAGSRLYVSNWGDSTVSVIDPSGTRAATWFVGPHPSGLVLRGSDLFVALAGSNAVARVDVTTGRVIEQLTVSLGRREVAPVGSDPGGLALSPDGRTLYVALAGNNAVAVVRVGPRTMAVRGLIPAGWYPTAVAVSADGRTLYVANGKGAGSGANPTARYIGNVITGSLSIVPVPDSAALAAYTARVYALSPYSNAALRGLPVNRLRAYPRQIKSVVYIIRENRTYDQVLGDVTRGNGDPALTIFGDSVTPNAHAIARRWVLFDNFYVDGEVSADGHEWTTRAFANDYNEKTWPAIYSNRRDWDISSGEDIANRAETYLWDAARRKGLWVVNFGEMTTDEPDTVRTNIAGLKGITADHYPGFIMEIPDTVRAALFADSVASWDRQGRFPDLVILYLPRDHTVGRRAGQPTPRAMVADNDVAIGRVIERLSRSPAWARLAVFAVEDDAQNGPDHVDAHRSVLLVASAYARQGAVDSTFYTTSSVVRSIGLILGLPPRSQYDAGATPLWNAFAARADLAPYAALPARWPLDELNPRAFRSRVPDADLARPDAADEDDLNEEIWSSVRPHERMPAPRRAFPLGVRAGRGGLP